MDLFELLMKNAEKNGIFFVEKHTADKFVSYKDLLARAYRRGEVFQKNKIQENDKVIICCRRDEEVILNFWACILRRIVPTILPYIEKEAELRRAYGTWKKLGKASIITDDATDFCDRWNRFCGFSDEQERNIADLVFDNKGKDENVDVENIEWNPPVVQEDCLFMLQFSSGSTGTPKGILLKYRNIINEVLSTAADMKYDSEDVFCSWKPLSHDYGLIAFHIMPMVIGATQVRISHDLFLSDPIKWIEIINKYRVSVTAAPNFGYKLVLEHFDPKRAEEQKWDLSCVRIAQTGSERISLKVCEGFTDILKPYGFREIAMKAGYGLAENTLMVSTDRSDERYRVFYLNRNKVGYGDQYEICDKEDAEAIENVAVGRIISHSKVRIMFDGKEVLDRIGEIQVNGPCITDGYFEDEEETRKLMTEDGWLHTGDLGLIYDNVLTIVGRLKELIIVGGKNYNPLDIEEMLKEEVNDDRIREYAAGGIRNDQYAREDIVIFLEYNGELADFKELEAKVKKAMNFKLGIVPNIVVPVRKFPKTASGKIQRSKLVETYLSHQYDDMLSSHQNNKTIACYADTVLNEMIREEIKNVVGLDNVGLEDNLLNIVSSSYTLMVLIEKISEKMQVKMNPIKILENPTIRGIIDLIRGKGLTNSLADCEETKQNVNGTDVAIIGMALSFPGGVSSADVYWDSLIRNKCLLEELPEDRWKEYSWDSDEITTTTGGFLKGVEYFDASFFGISGIEAQEMDPQQRLLLELCWKAIENAGYAPKKLKGKEVGVFVGISNNDYLQMEKDFQCEDQYAYTGNMFNSAAGRISYLFDFKGPSMAIDTACSSAIYSIKQACLAINDEECDTALVGAVNLMLTPDIHRCFSKLGALSPQGRCNTFDKEANGYVRSEGGAVFVLKKLRKAKEDRDHICGIIKSCVVNHNGRTGGLTVPSGETQARMISEAIKRAHLTIDDIGYIEAHGTGTQIGDPQELYALQEVFGKKKEKLKVGSVKTNLGHLEAASGMASVAKVLLAMQHKEIPASLFYKTGNPLFDWKVSNLSIVSKNEKWNASDRTFYAGITALGISGSNGHLILESYENKQQPYEDEEDFYLLQLSVQSLNTVQEYLAGLKKWSESHQYGIGVICRNLAQREELRYRSSIVVKKNMDFGAVIDKVAPRGPDLFKDSKKSKKIAFVFSGQGSQYEKMGRALYQKSDCFREKMDEIFNILEQKYQINLKEIIFGEDGLLEKKPLYTQLAIFAVGVSLCAYWDKMNVSPDFILGHSIGEFAALHIAGGISLEDAIELLYCRATEVEKRTEKGKMLALLADIDKVNSLLAGIDNAYVSVINADENVTVSGTREAIEKIEKAARAESIFVEELKVYYPFHSELMRGAADGLRATLDEIQMERLTMPFYSTIEKRWYNAGEKVESEYWYHHLLKTVYFADSVKDVLDDDILAVEIGANAVLAGIVSQILGKAIVIPSQRKGMEIIQILDAVGKLWENGIDVSVDSIYLNQSYLKLFDLPNTVFYKKYYWVAKGKEERSINASYGMNSLKTSEREIDENQKPENESRSIKERLYGIISDLLYVEKDELNDTDAFFSFGMDSLRLFQLKNQVWNVFQVEVGIKELFADCNTIEKLCTYVSEKQVEATGNYVQDEDGVEGTKLSLEEKGIYFISQGKSGNRAYQNVRTINFVGKMDPIELKEKVKVVMQRHELLQSVYKFENSNVLHSLKQDTEPEYIETKIIDKASEKKFYDFLFREFDFSNSLLWRWAFYEDAEGKDHAVFVFHHIIADHHATDIFIKELEAAFCGVELKQTLSYGDYVRLQAGRETEASRQWWKQKLTPLPERLAFNVNRESNTLDRFEGNTTVFHIASHQFDKAKEIIENNQFTAFNFYLAVWAIVLSKMGRRKSFVVGTPFDHRADGDFSNTLGNFVDSLPLLVEVDRSLSFKEWIAKLQNSCFEMVEHSDCSFNRIVSDLGINPEKDMSPLFNVMYTYVNEQKGEYSFGKTKGSLHYVGNRYTTFELTIGMVEQPSEVTVKFDYATMYFSETKVKEYITEFSEVLNRVINNAEIPVNELLTISNEQYEEIQKLSCGEMRDIQTVTFRDIMRKSFSQYASYPAMEFGNTVYSYDELYHRVKRAAGEIKYHGVERGEGVAVILPLSPEVIISMLAIQKIGAYWIPLDVAFPKDRVEYIIQKSNAKMIICQEAYSYKNDFGCPYVTIEQLMNSKEECEYDSNTDPNDTAYVIFTSGTTGKPKGVELPQIALCNFLIGMKEALNWEQGKRVACMTTPSFDIFLLESMLTLSTGGCVVIADKQNTMSPDRIARFIVEKNVNYLQLTPTRLKMIDVDRESTIKILNQIEAIYIGGEQFPSELLSTLQESGKRIYNVYGPTETCIWSTVKDLTKSQNVTIGRPILNTYTYVLDENGKLLSPEEGGDLWIGGLGVAKGYINDPKITEDKFKKNEFHTGMIYMTGDRAKWVNGELVCLGRSDFQVKIRGYRIELEELEKVIIQYPGIHNAAVCVNDQGNGNKTLIAFYEESRVVDKMELKRFMEQKVPQYMVPSGFMAVDKFPTTQSGKIDRKQLLLSNHENQHEESQDIGLTEKIERIYKNVLGINEIDLTSSFFDLGGNSFSLIILLKQLNELCECEIDVTDLFADSSILGVERLISTMKKDEDPKGILLPEGWNSRMKNSEYAVTTRISDETVQNIRAFQEKYHFERECLFASTLATCISKKMGYAQFGIWVVNNERESQYVEFDFSKDNSINGCLKNVKDALDSMTGLTDHKKLTESGTDESRVRICIGDLKYVSYQFVQSAFDVLVGYSIEEKKVKLQSDYGIDEKNMSELLNSFMYILKVITQKM